MYNELYEAWKRELENFELGNIPSDFYSRIADYLRRLKEEGRMLDKRTAKANLLKRETRNAKRMVHGLIRARYRKLVRVVGEGKKVSLDVLTTEEEKVYAGVSPFAEVFRSFTEEILRGRTPKVTVDQKLKRAVLRFLKNVPAIIGADMETYGPFKVEDVASLPAENAKLLVKQGLAEKVEV